MASLILLGYVKDNAVLQGSVIETLQNKSPKECETECVDQFQCKSFNSESSGERKCQLNYKTEADKTENVSLTTKHGWKFMSTNYSDPWVGKVCKEMKPCAINHVCTDICQCPGYICYKCRTKNIGINCLTEISITGFPLGLEDNTITDYQLSSSSHYNLFQHVKTARLNSANGWCANLNDQKQFIQVDFISRKIITDVAVQGHKFHLSWVKTYQLQYTEDKIEWKLYEEDGVNRTFLGPPSNDVIKKENLQYYIHAYMIKLKPMTWDNHICMRVEVYGVEDPWQPYLPKVITGYPLGLQDKRVKDYQMSASTQQYQYSQFAFNGRLHLPGKTWCASISNNQQFLRVDFPTRKIITDVEIQGNFQVEYWVKNYQINYTEDSYTWQTYMENSVVREFIGSTEHSIPVKQKLQHYIRAFAIKLNPTSWRKWTCMRIELYGFEDLQQPDIPTGCKNHEKPLGMASSLIPDARITASSFHTNRFPQQPSNARLNKHAAWCAGSTTLGEYVQVDLGKKMIITAVALQGRPITIEYQSLDWVISYKVSFALGNLSFQYFPSNASPKIFQGVTDSEGIVKSKVDPQTAAQRIRVTPSSTYQGSYICLRMELYGCDPM